VGTLPDCRLPTAYCRLPLVGGERIELPTSSV
jgi:hypothetical protein